MKTIVFLVACIFLGSFLGFLLAFAFKIFFWETVDYLVLWKCGISFAFFYIAAYIHEGIL